MTYDEWLVRAYAEWQVCTHPGMMLARVDREKHKRKLRLWSVAYCRSLWDKLPDEASRAAIQASEDYAERLIDKKLLKDAHRKAWDVYRRTGSQEAWFAAWASEWKLNQVVEQMHFGITNVLQDRASLVYQAMLLRDIFGPLSFRSVTIDVSWLRWNHGTVSAIARRIYDERAFHDMPILGDALEDAGCTDADILTHCRQPGEHVRGCWVVDLLLGKE
jgi:hypothetical protein